jgi:pyridoxamine 5'-phosphate oxidase
LEEQKEIASLVRRTHRSTLAYMDFNELRLDYQGKPLTKADCASDPIEQFTVWFDEAVHSQVPIANGMTLATVSADGQPSARIVLLKDVSDGRFVFFSNYDSRKGGELSAQPRAALLFWWEPLARQVRIEGVVHRAEERVSDDYFATRPRGSNLAAMASEQSRELDSRQTLMDRIARLEREQEGKELVRPDNWGGFALEPARFEFWQGRPDRTHDRLIYQKDTRGDWELLRLYP